MFCLRRTPTPFVWKAFCERQEVGSHAVCGAASLFGTYRAAGWPDRHTQQLLFVAVPLPAMYLGPPEHLLQSPNPQPSHYDAYISIREQYFQMQADDDGYRGQVGVVLKNEVDSLCAALSLLLCFEKDGIETFILPCIDQFWHVAHLKNARALQSEEKRRKAFAEGKECQKFRVRSSRSVSTSSLLNSFLSCSLGLCICIHRSHGLDRCEVRAALHSERDSRSYHHLLDVTRS